jgi:predicted homoserine dehydrogenase-like protein
VPFGIARAVLFGDAVVAAEHGPCVNVIATAKKELNAGDTLDGIGGFTAYGQCENHSTVATDNLLPLGLAEGCRLKHRVGKDQVITFDDVVVPDDSLSHRLFRQQLDHFEVPVSAGTRI